MRWLTEEKILVSLTDVACFSLACGLAWFLLATTIQTIHTKIEHRTDHASDGKIQCGH